MVEGKEKMVASVQLYRELHLHLHTRRETKTGREGRERVEEGRRERERGKRQRGKRELYYCCRVRSSFSQPLKVS